VGTDIDDFALENCQKIIEKNPNLIDFVSLQQQTDSRFLFKNIIEKSDKFSFTICNPPFHASAEDAANATSRKTANLFGSKNTTLNFGGQNSELWTAGGELAFITQMIYESRNYPLQVLWFTTLVSKKENLTSLYKTLNKVEAVKIETINMAQGNKISRILVWTFQTDKQRNEWKF
jgi:23S rRNA (adenine1618-N6)-methyltransferase